MDHISRLSGWVRIRYTGADRNGVFAELERLQIGVYHVRTLNELTMEFSTYSGELDNLQRMSEKRGDRFEIIRNEGLYRTVRALAARKLLLFGMLALGILGTFLSGRILFISVEGNDQVAERQIIEEAAKAGLSFGTSRRDVRSEQIKNRLLDAVKELKWAGVNTYGSRAVITVREREQSDEESKVSGIRHIVAKCDGIISSVTVTTGNGVCSVAQAVKKGELLISGYTDCGLVIRAEAADGTVLAETNRKSRVLTPDTWRIRGSKEHIQTHYSLIIRKKRINFYKGSGISGGTCVKMSSEYVLTLPGGYQLPVSLVKERIVACELETADVTDPQVYLREFAAFYLGEQMLSGTVTRKEETVQHTGSVWILDGQYACIEDIGTTQDEKIGDLHGKTDGANRERGSGG